MLEKLLSSPYVPFGPIYLISEGCMYLQTESCTYPFTPAIKRSEKMYKIALRSNIFQKLRKKILTTTKT